MVESGFGAQAFVCRRSKTRWAASLVSRARLFPGLFECGPCVKAGLEQWEQLTRDGAALRTKGGLFYMLDPNIRHALDDLDTQVRPLLICLSSVLTQPVSLSSGPTWSIRRHSWSTWRRKRGSASRWALFALPSSVVPDGGISSTFTARIRV